MGVFDYSCFPDIFCIIFSSSSHMPPQKKNSQTDAMHFLVFFFFKNMGLVSRVFFFFGELMSAHFPLPLFFTDNGRLPKKTEKEDLLILFPTFSSAPTPGKEERAREQTKMDISLLLPLFFRICDHVCSVTPHLKSSFAATDLFSPFGFCICVHISHLFCEKKPFPFHALTHTTIFFFFTTNTWQQHCPFRVNPNPKRLKNRLLSILLPVLPRTGGEAISISVQCQRWISSFLLAFCFSIFGYYDI